MPGDQGLPKEALTCTPGQLTRVPSPCSTYPRRRAAPAAREAEVLRQLALEGGRRGAAAEGAEDGAQPALLAPLVQAVRQRDADTPCAPFSFRFRCLQCLLNMSFFPQSLCT